MSRFLTPAFLSAIFWAVTFWLAPTTGWAQDGIPIGTVPLFPPVADRGEDNAGIGEASLLQLNLSAIELSKSTEATGVGGRLAIRSGLHLSVSEDLPQQIQIPVQLIAEEYLGSLFDPDSGIRFESVGDGGEGLLTIPFKNEFVQGVASVSTGRMKANGASVIAEVRSVEILVGPFKLGNESQFGGVANILFTGTLMPDVFLVGISLRSTRELANSWGQIVGIGNDIALVDVMFSADLEAGFIGLFDGNAALTIRTSNSWRSMKPLPETRMLVAGGQLPFELLEPGDYSVSVDGDSDVYQLDLVTGLSGFALVIVAEKVTQTDEGPVDQPTPTPATEEAATQPAADNREPDIIPQPTTTEPGGSSKTVALVLVTVVAAIALATAFGRLLRRRVRD